MSRTREYRMDRDDLGALDLSDALGVGADMALLYGPDAPGPGPSLAGGLKGDGADITPGQGYLSVVIPAGTTAIALTRRKDTASTFRVLISYLGNDTAIWDGYTSGNELRFRLFNKSEITYPSTTFPIENFDRVMWAVAGGVSYLLVNGVVIGSGADAIGIRAGTYAVGGQDTIEQRELPGIIDEFYTYDDSLANQAAVEALAASDLQYATANSAELIYRKMLAG